jgi:hypothetical protein
VGDVEVVGEGGEVEEVGSEEGGESVGKEEGEEEELGEVKVNEEDKVAIGVDVKRVEVLNLLLDRVVPPGDEVGIGEVAEEGGKEKAEEEVDEEEGDKEAEGGEEGEVKGDCVAYCGDDVQQGLEHEEGRVLGLRVCVRIGSLAVLE